VKKLLNNKAHYGEMKTKKTKTAPSVLFYCDSQTNSDLFYLGRIFIPDAFLAFTQRGKSYAVVSALEYGRTKEDSTFDEVLSLETVREQAAKALRRKHVETAHIVKYLAKIYEIPSFRLHPDTPASLVVGLQSAEVPFEVGEHPFFPESLVKTDEEAKAIAHANKISSAGIRAAIHALEDAKIKHGKLYLKDELLTSERMRMLIEVACLEAGGTGDCIAAGGNQACDPHCFGSGPLRPNELIIVDVFPRDKKSGYYGDMTRTFLKGRANEVQKEFVAVVKEAHKRAIDAVKPRIKASKVHAAAKDFFDERGCETGIEKGKHYGFFHSTGHGLGLGLHEPLRISQESTLTLKKGMVFTIEPGLYYPGLGGCRIEDVVQVTKEGSKLLSSLHYKWEIR